MHCRKTRLLRRGCLPRTHYNWLRFLQTWHLLAEVSSYLNLLHALLLDERLVLEKLWLKLKLLRTAHSLLSLLDRCMLCQVSLSCPAFGGLGRVRSNLFALALDTRLLFLWVQRCVDLFNCLRWALLLTARLGLENAVWTLSHFDKPRAEHLSTLRSIVELFYFFAWRIELLLFEQTSCLLRRLLLVAFLQICLKTGLPIHTIECEACALIITFFIKWRILLSLKTVLCSLQDILNVRAAHFLRYTSKSNQVDLAVKCGLMFRDVFRSVDLRLIQNRWPSLLPRYFLL